MAEVSNWLGSCLGLGGPSNNMASSHVVEDMRNKNKEGREGH